MTNKRIKEISPGVFHEILADRVTAAWDPANETADFNFVGAKYLRIGDQFISRVESDSTLAITREDFLERSFEVNGRTITGGDVDMFIRLLFDEIYNASESADQLEPDPQ